jgi:hypothetical protein
MIADRISLSNFFKGWTATARKAHVGNNDTNGNTAACKVVHLYHSYMISCKIRTYNFACRHAKLYVLILMPHQFSYKTMHILEKQLSMLSPNPSSNQAGLLQREFDASGIASLKAKATYSSTQNPMKVEVVSALLWKCTTAALKAKSGINRPTFIAHSVNLRQRSVPTFTESSMGNLVWTPCALCAADEMELPCMVSKLREAITKINANIVRSLQGGEGFHKLCDHMKAMVGALTNAASSIGMNFISFTSWCNFGLYGIDFG